MVNKTSNNNNFGSPTILFEEKKVKKEDKEVSYWLEKLHTQEDTRQNINRKEGQSSNDIMYYQITIRPSKIMKNSLNQELILRQNMLQKKARLTGRL